jgi:hypothetical protein
MASACSDELWASEIFSVVAGSVVAGSVGRGLASVGSDVGSGSGELLSGAILCGGLRS